MGKIGRTSGFSGRFYTCFPCIPLCVVINSLQPTVCRIECEGVCAKHVSTFAAPTLVQLYYPLFYSSNRLLSRQWLLLCHSCILQLSHEQLSTDERESSALSSRLSTGNARDRVTLGPQLARHLFKAASARRSIFGLHRDERICSRWLLSCSRSRSS
jgi:hypothetical protein